MTAIGNPIDFAVAIIALNGGTLVGKTRLQKTMYLIQKLTDESVFDFEYGNFGTFSPEVARAADIAEARGLLQSDEFPGYYSIPYVKYSTREAAPSKIGSVAASNVKKWLDRIDQADAIVLELAATWLFLKDDEGLGEAQASSLLKRLKPTKASDKRLRDAKLLLSDLGF